jgi:hypothetical protein
LTKIPYTQAAQQMKDGAVGIGEHHNNHWGRMLVLKLLQCEGATHLLLEIPPERQHYVDQVTTASGAIDSAAADEADSTLWQENGVLRTSTVIYQAQKRGVKVICADHSCASYEGRHATNTTGMQRRNDHTAGILCGLAANASDIKGVILLGGIAHYAGSRDTKEQSITQVVQSTPGLNFKWVDASTKESSGFGVRLNA